MDSKKEPEGFNRRQTGWGASMSEMPFSNPSDYVDNHRDDLIYLLRNGEPYVRGLALYVLLEGGDTNDWQLIEREVELAQEVEEDVLRGIQE